MQERIHENTWVFHVELFGDFSSRDFEMWTRNPYFSEMSRIINDSGIVSEREGGKARYKQGARMRALNIHNRRTGPQKLQYPRPTCSAIAVYLLPSLPRILHTPTVNNFYFHQTF